MKQKLSAATRLTIVLATAVVLSACTSSKEPVTKTLSTEPSVSGAPVIEKIGGKGGTKIAVLVNKTPITSNQIKRRAAFVRLRRIKGNSTSIATNELIDEAIKLQEARRIRALASDAEVNAAYARFAKGNKLTTAQLTRILTQRGVTKRGFQDFIRANISWQRAVAARVRSEGAGGASNAAATSPEWLPAPGSETNRETEYTIQQIVFIIPAAKRSSLLARRRLEAKRFRNSLNGCTNGKELAAGLRDVTVLDRGRLLDSDLPPRWRKDIRATPAGKVTRVQDNAQGVEMIAVCRTRQVIGKAKKGGEVFSDEKFRDTATKVEKTYFEEIKARAVVQRR